MKGEYDGFQFPVSEFSQPMQSTENDADAGGLSFARGGDDLVNYHRAAKDYPWPDDPQLRVKFPHHTSGPFPPTVNSQDE